jgi:hypothetical protein
MLAGRLVYVIVVVVVVVVVAGDSLCRYSAILLHFFLYSWLLGMIE